MRATLPSPSTLPHWTLLLSFHLYLQFTFVLAHPGRAVGSALVVLGHGKLPEGPSNEPFLGGTKVLIRMLRGIVIRQAETQSKLLNLRF